jgi:adenylate cyclase, class 2
VPAKLEREIKLPFDSPETARRAVASVGASPFADRRLQHDRLLDTADAFLTSRGAALRVRTDAGRTILTFKGRPQASTMKLREEIETDGGDADILLMILERLGFRVLFRYEKYRQEYKKGDVIIAVDETPIGTFVEIEGGEADVTAVAHAMGRGPEAYVLESYRGLFARHCEEHGVPVTNMLFNRG